MDENKTNNDIDIAPFDSNKTIPSEVDEQITLSKTDWDAINGRNRYNEPVTPIDMPDSAKDNYILPMEDNLGETKRFYAQDYPDDFQTSSEVSADESKGYQRETSYVSQHPKKTGDSSVLNWWNHLDTDTKVMTGFLTVLIPIFLIGLCMVIGASKTPTSSDLVLKDYKKVYELGTTVKVDVSKYIDVDSQPSAIDTNSIELYSTLFTNTSKYTYDNDTGVVVSKGKEYLEAGTYTITIQYKKNGTSKEKDITLKVKDTKAPDFVDFNSSIYVIQNAQSVNFSNYFEAEDLSQTARITTDSASSVNLTKTGIYDMKVTAVDASDNKNEQTCRVHVISANDVKNGKKLTTMKNGTVPMGEEDVSEAALKKNAERKKVLQEQISNLKTQLSEYNSSLEASKKNIESVNSQIEKYDKLLSSEQAKVEKYRQAVLDAQSAIDNATQDDGMVDLEKKLSDANYQYQQALNNSRANEYQTKLNALNDELYYAQLEQSKTQSNIDAIQAEISSEESELSTL